MRWIPLAILAWLLVVVQTTVGRLLAFELSSVGAVGPDLLAPLAVFVALRVQTPTDAMLAGCLLGFLLDLTTAGGVGSAAVVGVMPLTYALATRLLFGVREAFFRQRIGTQMLMTLMFCLISHGLWVTIQSALAYGSVSWSTYGATLVQAGAIACYSAVLAPEMFWGIGRRRKWLIPRQAERDRTTRHSPAG